MSSFSNHSIFLPPWCTCILYNRYTLHFLLNTNKSVFAPRTFCDYICINFFSIWVHIYIASFSFYYNINNKFKNLVHFKNCVLTCMESFNSMWYKCIYIWNRHDLHVLLAPFLVGYWEINLIAITLTDQNNWFSCQFAENKDDYG